MPVMNDRFGVCEKNHNLVSYILMTVANVSGIFACYLQDCMYLHDYGDGEASFTKEEMQSGKHQDYEQKLADTYLTPQTPNPNLATQLSTSSSRSATGDAGTNITNGPTSSNNSKSSASNQRSAVFKFSSSTFVNINYYHGCNLFPPVLFTVEIPEIKSLSHDMSEC